MDIWKWLTGVEGHVAGEIDLTPGIVTDERLRDYGFRILSRPGNGQPNIWIMDGVEFLEREAIRCLAEELGELEQVVEDLRKKHGKK